MTNNNASTNANGVETLLHESELRIKQLELDLQFKKNLAYFKEKIPAIYEQHVNHTPTELRLEYDQRGFVNLVNFGQNTHPVYEDDPKAFSHQQVKNFIAKPQVSTCGYGKAVTPSKTHKHIPIQNALVDELDINNLSVTPQTDVPIGCMIITGCGLWYHIPELLENLEINNIIIFDSHKDSFYASLHTIDWEPLLERFTKAGRAIYFLLDQTPEIAMTHIGEILHAIGLHNMVYYYNYYHFYSKVEKDFSDLFAKQFHIMASSTGYFDDEQVGLSHTIHNLKNGIKLFSEKPYPKPLPHALVIGNGPSLDLHIEFIKEHRDDTILFSCGTALGSLAKLGIKPDFHVEVERNINITEWIKKGTTAEYREGVALLCLNTISPAAADLFSEAYMAKKPYDIGESYIDKFAASHQATLLEQCNPTVSNA